MSPRAFFAPALSLVINVFFASQANAQSVTANTRMNRSEAATVHAGFSGTQVTYKADKTDVDLKHSTLGAGLGYELANGFRLLIQGGYTAEAKADFLDDKGSGTLWGGGVAATLAAGRKFRLDGSALYLSTSDEFSEDVGGQKVHVDISTRELQLGLTGSCRVTPNVEPYVTLTGIPFSDGDVKSESSVATGRDDIERKDRVGMHAGLSIASGRLGFRPDFAVFGEQSFTLAMFYRI